MLRGAIPEGRYTLRPLPGYERLLLPALIHVTLQAVTGCDLVDWPVQSVVSAWPHNGAREKCFCGYAGSLGQGRGPTPELQVACPDWVKYVSTDGATPNRITQFGNATVLGVLQSNATMSEYGCMKDWSLDLGSGYDSGCNRSVQPNCISQGTHILSIPRFNYLHDCCSSGQFTLASMLKSGRIVEVCTILHDLIEGGIRETAHLEKYRSCSSENEDPTAANVCLAQCFHIRPDVFYLHLHTTAGVKAMRDGPVDSGLGPNFNESETGDESIGFGRYNLCACEPESWARDGRGHCPDSQPSSPLYAHEATTSICKNLAGIVGLAPDICTQCAAAA